MKRRFLYATVAGLMLSGLAWATAHYLHAPLLIGEGAAMKIHGACAMLALVLLGTLLPGHVVNGWNGARKRKGGAVMISLFSALALTSYLLYYAGGERLRAATSIVHLLIGLVLPLALAVHAARSKLESAHAGRGTDRAA